ncbi:MAG: chromosome segregation protein SMC [Deltaproteobacteria bacterium]|nr:chromosome segregation protein SMC [Deltaproteobacteria bacterium]
MRVKRLEINGFKSFADRTSIEFPQGLCAVVGPNGCGKSNVVDAVRWVLGEQSARLLRGHSMEDVIFGGAQARKPGGMAEVSVVFENDGTVKASQFADLSEIMVTRRLYRSGDSDYLINRMPCRLKDIQQLLMDTGLGNRAYAIIEQGRVASFIEARPEERRLWLEEAAGITRYKNQKKVSLRKMEGARENLARLNDIVLEVEKQMERLQRQAKKALRHQELTTQVRDLDLTLSCLEFHLLSERLAEADAEHQALLAQLEVAQDRAAALELDLETARLSFAQAEEDINLTGRERLEAQGNINRAENELTLLGQQLENQRNLAARLEADLRESKARLGRLTEDLERARAKAAGSRAKAEESQAAAGEAGQALEACRAEVARLEREGDGRKHALVDLLSQQSQAKNRLGDLDRREGELQRRQEQFAGRREQLATDLAALEEQAAAAEEELADGRQELDQLTQRVEELREERRQREEERAVLRREEEEANRQHARLAAETDALAGSLASHDWVGGAVKKVLDAAAKGQTPAPVLGVAGELLKAAPGWEELVETALGPDLQAVVVATAAQARELLAWAAPKKLGRLRVAALEELRCRGAATPAGSTALLDKVSPAPGLEPLAWLLEGAGACPEEAAAWEAGGALAPGQWLAGPEGFRLERPGVAQAGKGGGSVLARQNELDRRRAARDAAREEWEQTRALSAEAQEEAEYLRQEEAEQRSRLEELGQTSRQAEQDLFRARETASLKSRQLEGLDFDSGEALDELDQLTAERERLEIAGRDLAQRVAREEAALSQDQSGLEAARERLEEVRRQESEARLAVSSLENQAEQAAREATRLARELEGVGERVESLAAELTSGSDTLASLEKRRRDAQSRLGSLYSEMDRREAAYREAQESLSQIQSDLALREAELKAARAVLKQVEEATTQANWRKKELTLNRDNLAGQVAERCRVDLAQDCARHLPAKGFDLEEGRERFNRLKNQLLNLGPVNLEAIAEHEALAERHEFLTSQRADLEASLDDLLKAVRKINRTSRERFLETLEEVNQRLSEIFPVLFGGGGVARLELEPNVDPLEAGLHLMVELPGKKVRNLEAFSGGEKALSAMAVLFALFLIRPAPFCILDEVDAPLDEANTGRFLDLLRRLSRESQILTITHNRRTMEIMDMLYGVTMEEKGVSKVLSVSLSQGESLAA